MIRLLVNANDGLQIHHNSLEPPDGYVFLSVDQGQYVLDHCRLRSLQRMEKVYLVYHSSNRTFLGLHVSRVIVRKVVPESRARTKSERDEVYAKKRRDKDNARFVLKTLYPSMPLIYAEDMLHRAYDEQVTRIGDNNVLTDEEKMTAAVENYARHALTPYKEILAKAGWASHRRGRMNRRSSARLRTQAETERIVTSWASPPYPEPTRQKEGHLPADPANLDDSTPSVDSGEESCKDIEMLTEYEHDANIASGIEQKADFCAIISHLERIENEPFQPTSDQLAEGYAALREVFDNADHLSTRDFLDNLQSAIDWMPMTASDRLNLVGCFHSQRRQKRMIAHKFQASATENVHTLEESRIDGETRRIMKNILRNDPDPNNRGDSSRVESNLANVIRAIETTRMGTGLYPCGLDRVLAATLTRATKLIPLTLRQSKAIQAHIVMGRELHEFCRSQLSRLQTDPHLRISVLPEIAEKLRISLPEWNKFDQFSLLSRIDVVTKNEPHETAGKAERFLA